MKEINREFMERKTEKADEFEVTDNNPMTKMTEPNLTKASDKYTDSIDLSNACREFYQSRKRAAEVVKEKLASSGRQRTTKKKTSIDVAMETLRNEMAGLMDQDLSLMKQLLTLNEAIEDIKWQRNYYNSQSSMAASSCDLSESDWSVSDTDMFGSEGDNLGKQTTLTTRGDAIEMHESRTVDNVDQNYLLSAKLEITGNSRDSQTVKSLPIKNQNFVVSNETTHFLGLPKDLDFFLNVNPNSCHQKLDSFDFRSNEHVLRKQITV